MPPLFSRPAGLCLAVLLGLAPFVTTPAAAQSQAAEPMRFDIPAQPLDQAVTELARQAGLAVGGDAALLRGKQAPALAGEYTPRQALDRLLAGSGLTARFTDAGTVTLAEAGAQDGNGPTQLGPIQVTGEGPGGPVEGFRAESSGSATNVNAPLIETPATVNVLTRDFLDATQQRHINDVFDYVPGVNRGSDAFFNFSIRGFGTDFFASRSGSSVFVDDFHPPGRLYHFDDALFERVDILKGSSAVLYGSAQPGGIVRYVSKRPEFEQRTRLEASLGSFETARGMLDSTGPLNDDGTLAYRLIVTGSTFNRTQHGESDDVAKSDRFIVNPAITWRTPTGGELYLSYEYSEHKFPLDPGVARLSDGTFLFDGEPLLSDETTQDNSTHVVTVDFSQPISENWDFVIGGRYSDQDTFRRDLVSFGSFAGDPDLFDVSQFVGEFDHEMFNVRAEVDGRFSTLGVGHQLTVGVNYLDEEIREFGNNFPFTADVFDPRNPDFSSVTPAPLSDSDFNNDFEQTRVYIQDYATITDSLKVFGGLSWTDADVQFGSDSVRSGEDEALDYQVGAIYNLTEVSGFRRRQT